MKNAKKALAWLLLASMPAAAAETAEITRAAAPLEIADFEHYPSRTYDELTGNWSVHDVHADALIDRFWSHKINYGEVFSAFYLEIEGNALTGVWTPVLRVLYNGQKTLDATAVSILADGVRYDFAASSEKITYEEYYNAQLVSVPLNAEGVTALVEILAAEDVSVRLIGDAVYTSEINPETTVARRRIEAASLAGLEAGIALLDDAGLSEYALWDLSAAAWESEHGFAPAFMKSALVENLGDAKIADDFGMIIRNDQTRAARIAQEILIENGFMSGSASSSFTKNASNATRRAQQYLGLIVTGCMDAQLEQALAEGRKTDYTEAAALQPLSNVAEIALERYWFADGVSATNAPAAVRTVYNGDNAFLVCDGWIRNISAADLHLFMQMEAKVIYNDTYAYEATVVCERDDGHELDTLLLPMGFSRMIAYAEIPAGLMNDDGANWRVEFSANGETLEYTLQ